MENKKIPGFNYYLSPYGAVFNSKGQAISETTFKDKRYIRLYKEGKRYTLSVNKLIYELYGQMYDYMELQPGERAFRYKDSDYYITSYCRAYNSRYKRFLKVIYRNGYPTINVSYKGKREAVSIIKFLMGCGGQRV